VAVGSARRLLQYCQLPDKYSRDISRDSWNFSWCFKIFIYLFHDFSSNPWWFSAEPWMGNIGLDHRAGTTSIIGQHGTCFLSECVRFEIVATSVCVQQAVGIRIHKRCQLFSALSSVRSRLKSDKWGWDSTQETWVGLERVCATKQSVLETRSFQMQTKNTWSKTKNGGSEVCIYFPSKTQTVLSAGEFRHKDAIIRYSLSTL
jgi:hypothetical protein